MPTLEPDFVEKLGRLDVKTLAQELYKIKLPPKQPTLEPDFVEKLGCLDVKALAQELYKIKLPPKQPTLEPDFVEKLGCLDVKALAHESKYEQHGPTRILYKICLNPGPTTKSKTCPKKLLPLQNQEPNLR